MCSNCKVTSYAKIFRHFYNRVTKHSGSEILKENASEMLNSVQYLTIYYGAIAP